MDGDEEGCAREDRSSRGHQLLRVRNLSVDTMTSLGPRKAEAGDRGGQKLNWNWNQSFRHGDGEVQSVCHY